MPALVPRLRAPALALLPALLLSACSLLPQAKAPSAPAAMRQPELAAFKATLSPQQVMPAAKSAATGELVAVLNRRTGLLRWKMQFSRLSGPVTSAHFHSPAMEGEVASPVLSLGKGVASPHEGRATLNARQRANLLAGQWYVNLRTAAHPQGELRGQLIEQ